MQKLFLRAVAGLYYGDVLGPIKTQYIIINGGHQNSVLKRYSDNNENKAFLKSEINFCTH